MIPSASTLLARQHRLDISLGLAVLEALRADGTVPCELTQDEIAEACGCTQQAIARIERRALRKIRPLLVQTSRELAA